MTDLSAAGNEQVREALRRYVAKPQHCTPPDRDQSHPRVLLTGFGLFSKTATDGFHVPYNVSGLVVGAMSEPAFWPDAIQLAEPSPETFPTDAHLRERLQQHARFEPEDAGAKFLGQRLFTIDGKPVEVCFLNLAVRWDLAAAIVLWEASRLQPDSIILTGLGSRRSTGVYEMGARNSAKGHPGYYGSGAVNRANTPVVDPGAESTVILPPGSPGVLEEIAMTWPLEEIVAQATPLANAIGSANRYARGVFQLTAAKEAARTNNYVCNNISYVTLHGVKGVPIALAGESVRFSPEANAVVDQPDYLELPLPQTLVEKSPTVGFFHYPGGADDSPESLYGWGKVMAASMLASSGKHKKQ